MNFKVERYLFIIASIIWLIAAIVNFKHLNLELTVSQIINTILCLYITYLLKEID